LIFFAYQKNLKIVLSTINIGPIKIFILSFIYFGMMFAYVCVYI